jgi:hypothetical protein
MRRVHGETRVPPALIKNNILLFDEIILVSLRDEENIIVWRIFETICVPYNCVTRGHTNCAAS